MLKLGAVSTWGSSPEEMEFDILCRSTLEFSEGSPIASSSAQGDYDKEAEAVLDEEHKKEEKHIGSVSSSNEDESEAAATGSIRKLGGDVKLEEDDDGFRTPTSLNKKIPVIQQCPPAPKKPKSKPTKRKASSAVRRQLVFLDVYQEIGSLFPETHQADLGCKIKKARLGLDLVRHLGWPIREAKMPRSEFLSILKLKV